MDYRQAQEGVSAPEGMDAQQATDFLALLMSGELTVARGAGLLVSLAERGETSTELAAFVRGLLDRAIRVEGPLTCCDVCGTGGSGRTRFNISTTSAFVLASVGIPVAKHGNRGSRRPNGSFDLLEALDIPIDLSASALWQLLAETNLCFLFARTMHPAVGAVVPYRKAAAGRTIFNLAGPLANPVSLSHQVIGTIDGRTREVVAGALEVLGARNSLVVTGEPGVDEFSITGSTDFIRLSGGGRQVGRLMPEAAVDRDCDALPGGDAMTNAQTFMRLLNGEEIGLLKRLLCVSAGSVIDLWEGREPVLHGEGYARAKEALESGRALDKYNSYKRLASSLSR